MRLRYSGLNPAGQSESKITEVESVEALEGQLKTQGYLIDSIKPVRSFSLGKRKLKNKELIFLCSNLHNILRANIHIEESLDLVADQTNKRLRALLLQIKEEIRTGMLLSEAFSTHKEFPDLMVGTIKVGESTGDYVQSFEMLETYFTKREQLSKRIRKATSYPLSLLGMSTISIFGISIFALPRLVSTLQSLDVKLNAVSRGLMSFSSFMQVYGIIIAPLIVISVFGLRYFIKHKFQYQIDKAMFRIPVFKNLYRKFITIDFGQSLAMLMKAGVNIISALDIVIEITHNQYVREHIEEIKKAVIAGDPLSSHMSTQIFDKTVIGILAIGERSGSADESLIKASAFLDNELEEAMESALKILNPLLLIFISVIVLVVIYGTMGPMLDMYSQLGNG